VVAGATLLAILALLPVAQRSFAALVPPSEVLGPGLDPGGLATGLIQAALMVFGWLGVAIGLDRPHRGARPNPSAGIVVAGVAIVATVLSAAVFLPSYLASTAGPDPASLILYLVSEAATLAVAYAAWVVVGGAGLAPRAGTLLGAVALVLVVTASVVLAIASLVFAVADGETALGAWIPWMTTASLLGAAGNVGLVGAFLLGLADPAVEEAGA
jgi:hypothetical protein